jgi:hypothetical protein
MAYGLRLLLFAFGCSALRAPAQRPSVQEIKVTVQVLDGKSGHPISSETVELECLAGEHECPGFQQYNVWKSPPDHEGQINLSLSPSANTLIVDPESDEYDTCADASYRDRWYSIRDIQSTGILGKNDCGHPSKKALQYWQPQPGRLVVFIHRKPWWVRIFPYC